MKANNGEQVRKIFASNVKQEMEERDWIADNLAEATGLAISTVERVLDGEYFTSGIVEKICSAFNLDYWVLLVEVGE